MDEEVYAVEEQSQEEGVESNNDDDDSAGSGDAEEEEEGESQEEDGTTGAQENVDASSESTIIKATPKLPALTNPDVREIGHEAVWSLSSCKPGNGVTQLMDSLTETYWQSDGAQPHLINIHFSRRKAVCEVSFYLDYSLDESYTPKRIGIKSGVTFHDLEEVKVVEMHEPSGWISVPLHAEIDPLDNEPDEGADDDEEKESRRKRKPLRTHFIQICVLSMAQNGRDTHVRQVKLFGPRTAGDASGIKAPATGFALGLPRFQTIEMSQFSTIR
jgi:anaphase-promoting complex subunit 10